MCFTPAGGSSARDPANIYDEAVHSFNSGDIRGARGTLESLLRAHPNYFEGYSLYWKTIGTVENAHVQKRIVQKAVTFFTKVPSQRRNEAFYLAFLEACRILNDQARAQALRSEAIKRNPRGSIAQSALLDAARAEAEQDSRRGAAMLQDYLDRFDDNISWTEIASKDLVEIVGAHPDQFSPAELLVAATLAERNEKRFIDTFGQPIRYVLLMQKLANVLADRSPSDGLVYVNKGLTYVQEQWPVTGKDFEDTRRRLWPPLLHTYVALGNWQGACIVGEAVTVAIDAGDLRLSAPEESGTRMDYAVALDHLGSGEAAIRQRELAADPSKAWQLREEKLHREVLASEQRRPAQAFELQDLSGKTVRLRDFRGKVLVLSFWATWCGPCIGELDALQKLMSRYRSDPNVAFLAVSIDSFKDVVPPFVQKRGWEFPIAFSDGSIEGPYQTQSIPRLFVIDGTGSIRFEASGFRTDFPEQVAWMIEAVKP